MVILMLMVSRDPLRLKSLYSNMLFCVSILLGKTMTLRTVSVILDGGDVIFSRKKNLIFLLSLEMCITMHEPSWRVALADHDDLLIFTSYSSARVLLSRYFCDKWRRNRFFIRNWIERCCFLLTMWRDGG